MHTIEVPYVSGTFQMLWLRCCSENDLLVVEPGLYLVASPGGWWRSLGSASWLVLVAGGGAWALPRG